MLDFSPHYGIMPAVVIAFFSVWIPDFNELLLCYLLLSLRRLSNTFVPSYRASVEALVEL